MLPELVSELAGSVDKVTIDRISVIDTGGGNSNGNGGGHGLGRFVTQFPAAVVSLSDQIEAATGVDLFGALRERPAAVDARPETTEAVASDVAPTSALEPGAPASPTQAPLQ
jgi:hypothetical protein